MEIAFKRYETCLNFVHILHIRLCFWNCITNWITSFCFETSLVRHTCLRFLRPFTLASQIHPQSMFCQDTFLNTIFLYLMLILWERCRYGDPIKIQWAATWIPNQPSSANNLHLPSLCACLCSRRVTGLNTENKQVVWTFILCFSLLCTFDF